MFNPAPFVYFKGRRAEILEATPAGWLWVLPEGYHEATLINPNQIQSVHIHNPEATEHLSFTRQQWQKAEPQ